LKLQSILTRASRYFTVFFILLLFACQSSAQTPATAGSSSSVAGQMSGDSDSARVLFAQSLLAAGHRVTQHSVMIRGTRVDYDATVGGIAIHDAMNRNVGIFVYIAYTRKGVADAKNRPITFAWNGGPTGASNELHLSVLGPRRRAVDESGIASTPLALVDNPHSILDRTDLVFVDPIPTGLSVAIPPGKAADFYSVDSDGASVAQFIYRYLEEAGRLESPTYILGESYGTIRAAVVPQFLQELGKPLAGVIFVSSALDGNTIWEASGHLEPYYFYLPAYAAIAWYHHRLPEQAKDLNALVQEVQHFALTEFLTTLVAWPDVPADERERILAKLNTYTGLSKDFWEKSNLRVGTAAFARELLRDQGQVLTINDGRLSSPVPPAGANGGRGRGGAGSPRPNEAGGLMEAYLRDELGVANAPTYVTIISLMSRNATPSWDWSHPKLPSRNDGIPAYTNYLDDVAKAMKNNPQLRVEQHSGRYDLQCAAFPADWAMTRMNIPNELRHNVQMFDYDGGHMMYNVPSELVKFTDNLVAFYDQAPPTKNKAQGNAAPRSER
jgi:carboxypeptidase C (cathepsin A)